MPEYARAPLIDGLGHAARSLTAHQFLEFECSHFRLIVLVALTMTTLLILLTSRVVVCSARIVVDTQTHTDAPTQ